MSYSLRDAIWEFTLDCNLNCAHCGSSAGTPRKNELTTEECYEVCTQLAELHCENVCLMGGEPFLRDDWYEISRYINILNMDLSFVSNGLIVPDIIDRLERLDIRVVGISLDGMKKTHEKIRGHGTYDKTIKALDILNQRNIPTTIITTISKENFDDLLKMKDFLSRKGVNWQLQVAQPFGNFDRKKMISKEEFYSTALFIAKHSIKGDFDSFPVVGAHCFGYHSDLLPGVRWESCEAGIKSIGITSNGNIVGCLSMGQTEFIEGNIRDKSIVDIWESDNSFAYNRRYDESELGPNCRDCKYGSICKGGCNSMSYTITGELNNDPYCFHKIEDEIIEYKKGFLGRFF